VRLLLLLLLLLLLPRQVQQCSVKLKPQKSAGHCDLLTIYLL